MLVRLSGILFVSLGSILLMGFLVYSAQVADAARPNCAKAFFRIDHVRRVLEHEPNVYSVKTEGTDHVISEWVFGDRDGHEHVTIVSDVPEGEPMWASKRRFPDARDPKDCDSSGEIHIHHVSEINGAGWSREATKNTQTTTERETTTVVE